MHGKMIHHFIQFSEIGSVFSDYVSFHRCIIIVVSQIEPNREIIWPVLRCIYTRLFKVSYFFHICEPIVSFYRGIIFVGCQIGPIVYHNFSDIEVSFFREKSVQKILRWSGRCPRPECFFIGKESETIS